MFNVPLLHAAQHGLYVSSLLIPMPVMHIFSMQHSLTPNNSFSEVSSN